MHVPPPDFPIRLTVCDTAEQTRRLVTKLQDAGFTTDEISVLCSEEACLREFSEFVHEEPAGSQSAKVLNASGMAALGLGAAAAVIGVVTSGGAAIVAAGAFAGLAIAGTFAALMSTRGAEKELADYYDQAITHGRILVAVEPQDPSRRDAADEILGSVGTTPAALPKEDMSHSE